MLLIDLYGLEDGDREAARRLVARAVGDGCAVDTVFIGRQPTGETYHHDLRAQHPERDWILTRILRLEGIEEGLNKGGEVDTFSRYIYIHGAPADVQMGVPGSHGCVRMRNQDILSLFDRVPPGTEVIIRE